MCAKFSSLSLPGAAALRVIYLINSLAVSSAIQIIELNLATNYAEVLRSSFPSGAALTGSDLSVVCCTPHQFLSLVQDRTPSSTTQVYKRLFIGVVDKQPRLPSISGFLVDLILGCVDSSYL
jgi:hypothetical protein